DARKLPGEPDHCFGCSVAAAIDAHEAAERPMMRYEIVGDRTDHRCCALSELKIERVLKPHDLERAVGVALVAHSMIRDETDDRAELVSAPEQRVHVAIITICFWFTGRVLVLDVVRQR